VKNVYKHSLLRLVIPTVLSNISLKESLNNLPHNNLFLELEEQVQLNSSQALPKSTMMKVALQKEVKAALPSSWKWLRILTLPS